MNLERESRVRDSQGHFSIRIFLHSLGSASSPFSIYFVSVIQNFNWSNFMLCSVPLYMLSCHCIRKTTVKINHLYTLIFHHKTNIKISHLYNLILHHTTMCGYHFCSETSFVSIIIPMCYNTTTMFSVCLNTQYNDGTPKKKSSWYMKWDKIMHLYYNWT